MFVLQTGPLSTITSYRNKQVARGFSPAVESAKKLVE